MIEEAAIVTGVNNHSITIESNVKSTCSSCHQLDTCGSGQVAKAIPQRKLKLTLTSALVLDIGDEVIIGIPEKCMLQTASQVYLWPLLGLIVMSAIGQYLMQVAIFSHELYAVLLGIFGGYAGFRLAKYWQNNKQKASDLMPTILRKSPQLISVTEISSDC